MNATHVPDALASPTDEFDFTMDDIDEAAFEEFDESEDDDEYEDEDDEEEDEP